MKHYILTFTFLGFFSAVFCQQIPLYSFFDDNITLENPSLPRSEFIFDDYTLFIGSTLRDQWRGFEGAPETYNLRGSWWLPDLGFGLTESLGNSHIGISLIHDKISPFYFTGTSLQFGRLVFINPRDRYRSKMFLAGGLNLGVNVYQIKIAELGETLQNDPYVIGSGGFKVIPDVGLGVSFQHYFTKSEKNSRISQGYFVGFSIPQVMEFNLNYRTDNGELQIDRVKHYNFNVGAQFGDADYVRYKINGLGRYVYGSPWHFTGSMEVLISNWLVLGVGADSSASIHTRAGVNIPFFDREDQPGALRVVYGFSFGGKSQFSNRGATHEVGVTYMIMREEYD